MIDRLGWSRTEVSSAILRLVIVATGLALAIYIGMSAGTMQGLIVKAILVGAGIGFALRWPFAALVVVVFLVPLEVFTKFGGATINRFAVPCLTAGWGFRYIQTRQRPHLKKSVWIMLAWIGWGAISILWSTGRLWWQLVPSLLMAWILFAIVTGMVDSRRKMTWIIAAMMAGLLVFVIVWLSTAQLVAGAHLLPGYGSISISASANLASALIVCILAFALYARIPLRLLAIVLLVLASYLAFASGSRRSFVVVAAALLALLVLSRGTRLRTVALAWAMLITVYWALEFFLPLLPEGTQRRYTIAYTVETGISYRLNIWSIATSIWAISPIIGVGLGDFGVYTLLRSETFNLALNAHNMPLQILAEQGVIGLALWSWGWARIVLSAVRAYRASHTDADRLLSAVPLLLVVFFLVSGLINPTITWRLMWLAFGLAIAGESIICGETTPDMVIDGK